MGDESSLLLQLTAALEAGDMATVTRLLGEHPEIRDDPDNRTYWLFSAAEDGRIDALKTLLAAGMDVNHCDKPDTPLGRAVDRSQYEAASFLLSRGADPNLGRPIIGAINRQPESVALRLVKLLVEHGAEVNKLFELYGDKNKLFTALDWASSKPAIAVYLKALGAKTAKELRAHPASASAQPAPRDTPSG
jgi:ankyrin repeat protein